MFMCLSYFENPELYSFDYKNDDLCDCPAILVVCTFICELRSYVYKRCKNTDNSTLAKKFHKKNSYHCVRNTGSLVRTYTKI